MINTSLAHSIDYVMLIRLEKQEATSRFEVFVRHAIYNKGRFRGLFCQYLGFQWSGAHQYIPSKAKTDCYHWHFSLWEGNTILSGPLQILEAAYATRGKAVLPMYSITWKAASFEWVSEKQRFLQQAQTVGQVAVLLGPYTLLEMSMVEKKMSGSVFGKP